LLQSVKCGSRATAADMSSNNFIVWAWQAGQLENVLHDDRYHMTTTHALEFTSYFSFECLIFHTLRKEFRSLKEIQGIVYPVLCPSPLLDETKSKINLA
jgi:hypothetical protein